LKRYRKAIVHIVTQKKLRSFASKHGDCVAQIRTWEAVVRAAKWQNANNVKAAFPMVSVLSNDRFCFNIKGNDYRLIVKLLFTAGQVLIRFLGTHAEYDKVDANTI
jgi:mRNA interferase HigB